MKFSQVPKVVIHLMSTTARKEIPFLSLRSPFIHFTGGFCSVKLQKAHGLVEGDGIEPHRAAQAAHQEQRHKTEPGAAPRLPTQLPTKAANEPETACGKISLTLSIWVP